MLNKLRQSFSDPKQIVIAGTGLALLGFYVFYARKQIFNQKNHQGKHQLNLSLKKLVNQKKNEKFKKIVITQSSLNKSNFTGEVLSQVKAKLISNEIPTLVSCSPIKILSAGCQCFLQTLSHIDIQDEKQYVSYYENAARCQLVVQKTLVDIQSIKKTKQKVIILCDNNTMDLKVRAIPQTWEKFLSWNNISEEKLMHNYQIVIHLQNIDENNPDAQRQNKRIKQIWSIFPQYYSYKYCHDQSYDQNMERACNKIYKLISECSANAQQ